MIDVLHQGREFWVINKPADISCHPTKTHLYSSLAGQISLLLGHGAPIHFINRLDRETSGLVALGMSVEWANRLRSLWSGPWVSKEYVAIVHGVVDPSGVVDAPVGPYDQSLVYIKDQVREDGKPARTRYWRVATWERDGRAFSLVRLRLDTGRKHQIRIHMDWLGHPVVGDKLYGVDEEVYLRFVRGELSDDQRRALLTPHQALHAWRLSLYIGSRAYCFEAPPESWFMEFLPQGFDFQGLWRPEEEAYG